jgi:hypothetical protein
MTLEEAAVRIAVLEEWLSRLARVVLVFLKSIEDEAPDLPIARSNSMLGWVILIDELRRICSDYGDANGQPGTHSVKG